jgi:purine-cytosine permease-like protein
MKGEGKKSARNLRQTWSKALRWMRRRIPTGLRTVLGLLLIVGGIFGFLPVLGFWMVPFGLAVIALDYKVLSKRVRRRRRNHLKSTHEAANWKKNEDKNDIGT